MSILDPVQKMLAPDIWNEVNQMHSTVKQQILDTVYSFLDVDNVIQIFIIGTITGFQYKMTSDVDIQVVVDPPELAKHGPETLVYKVQHEVNGTLVHGTGHPINFFLYSFNGKLANWEDASFGVYNLLTDTWEASPGTSDLVRDPKLEYGIEFNTAQLYVNKFEKLVERWEQDIERVNISSNGNVFGTYMHTAIKAELKRDLEELIEFCHDLDRDRKTEYSLKWGIPRKNWRNLVYKVIEASKYKDYFEFLKDFKADDYYTKLYTVLQEPVQDKEPLISYRAHKSYHNLLPGIAKKEI